MFHFLTLVIVTWVFPLGKHPSNSILVLKFVCFPICVTIQLKFFYLKKKKTIRHSSASLFLRCITVTPALGSPERFLHTPALGSERYSSLSQSLLFQSSVGWKGKPFISSHYQRFFLVKTLGYLT